jgi:hypothetical protein
MVKGKTDPETAASEAVTAQDGTETAAEPKFPIAKLRAKCLHVFGVSVSTFDGATHGKTGEYSIDEIKQALKEWGKTEVK